MRKLIPALLAATLAAPAAWAQPKDITNASYDIAREIFVALNEVFVPYWKDKTGAAVEVKQSHAGTSRQARAIVEGLAADVVTFNQVTDIDFLKDQGFVAKDWQARLPHKASPWYSFPAFLVRAGNPKGVKDWSDLVRADVKSVFPNPKTSGNARYTYLAAYAAALEQNNGDQAKATEFVRKLLANVPVFDTGGRGSTTTFVERGIGDVLITFEAEVNSIRREYGTDKFVVVLPPVSLLAEFPVAVVDRVAEKRGSSALAKGYLEFLYTDQAQEVAAKFFHRPRNEAVAAKHAAQFPQIRLVTVEDVFGGWDKAQKDHFSETGTFEKVFGRK